MTGVQAAFVTNGVPQSTRRGFLRVAGVGLAGSLAGCSALSSGPPDVSGQTGLSRDASGELDDRPVFLAGDTDALPAPPERVDSIEAAWAAIATPDAAIEPLAQGLRQGTTIAFAGGEAAAALGNLLDAVSTEASYGVETVEGRPTETVVAEPRGDTVSTYQFIREGGFDDPVLDPLGWVMGGRIPDCQTFVPERSNDDAFDRIGTATIAGRLPTGETYAGRTVGYRHSDTQDVRRYRFRSSVHAAANEGIGIEAATRVADFANDAQLTRWFPNPHERNGVAVSNNSDPIEERLHVTFEPASDRARATLTGCCGCSVDETLTYDHRIQFRWERSGLFGSTERSGGGSGVGRWDVPQ